MQFNLLNGTKNSCPLRPDLETAIMVTAKWTCTGGGSDQLEEPKYWWQRVGTDAHSIEKGLVRYEAYQVLGEDALIIHETFENTSELKFHLTKGTANKYKKDIDKIAAPECYYFRGPVSWTIRTYSKFLHLPATYSSLGNSHTEPGGTMSDGITARRLNPDPLPPGKIGKELPRHPARAGTAGGLPFDRLGAQDFGRH